ncbi:MAG: XRE family transcriptional regulator [Termitinemataceae bacterium]|nr:MAG: XRE family transcriptional regulator [Termitinemataceae bacterium]
MAKGTALITPKILTWARERLSLSIEEAAEHTKTKCENLMKWENGTSSPTINQAKELANKLKIPYVYFFLSDPPQNIALPKNTDYRTPSNMPIPSASVELKALLFDAIQRRDVMLDLYKQMETEPPSFGCYYDEETSSDADIITAINKLLSFPAKPPKSGDREAFNFFRKKFENIGILVFQTNKIDKTEMRGVSIFYETFPIVIVNQKDSFHARIFTLFHELVHLITRTAGICDSSGMSEQSKFQIELKCNHIAAEVLVPTVDFLNNQNVDHLLENWSDFTVRTLGNKYYVSREVIIGRLLTLEKITLKFYREKLEQYNNEYTNIRKVYSKGDFKKNPPVEISVKIGKPYVQTVFNAYNQDLISLRDTVQYFDGLRTKHFEKLERMCFGG